MDGHTEAAQNHLRVLLGYVVRAESVDTTLDRLIQNMGSATAVFEADAQTLATIGGLSLRQAQFLRLLPSVARYVSREQFGKTPLINHVDVAAKYVKSLYYGEHYEQFYMLCLDKNGRLIECTMIQKGSVNETQFYPRLVVEAAIRTKAEMVVFTHNHPGGTQSFSMGDFVSTKQALQVLGNIGVALLDHIVVAGGQSISMRQKKFLAEDEWTIHAQGNEIALGWTQTG